MPPDLPTAAPSTTRSPRRDAARAALALALALVPPAASVMFRVREAYRLESVGLGESLLVAVAVLGTLAVLPLGLAALLFGLLRSRPAWAVAGAIGLVVTLASVLLMPEIGELAERQRFASRQAQFEALLAEFRAHPGVFEVSLGGTLNRRMLPDSPSNDLVPRRRAPSPLAGVTLSAAASAGLDETEFRRLHHAMARLGVAQVEVLPEGVLFRSRGRIAWLSARQVAPSVVEWLAKSGTKAEFHPRADGWFECSLWQEEAD